ncbi:MAG: tyrosine--tRNA ligase, partial [Chloroflexi bacterium]|nr:tyrosine--tRNA ligase [Chloroflexota bacterium]
TGLIGDPSGKATERPLLSVGQVRENAAGIEAQLRNFLSFEGPNAAIVVNNADWLLELRLIDFLRDVGKHFTVNALIAKESVRARLESREQGISYTEFSYILLQAYDFLHLFDRYGCTVQVGGSDQWGNITGGVDLIRRVRGKDAHGLTFPLLTTATGAKFGKSEAGAVWLDSRWTSPYALSQFWLNTDDRDAVRFLKLFTFLGLDEIEHLAAAQAANPGARPAQHALAFEFTRLVHGPAMARAAQQASALLFQTPPEAIDPVALEFLAGEIPTVDLAREELAAGIELSDLVARAGLADSKAAARRLIQQGGISVNNVRHSDPRQPIGLDHALLGRAILLRAGRKTHALVRVGG